MQKFMELIEKHVQWVAIGLGALFVLFMVYSYVLEPPAKVTVQNGTQQETLAPGEIDEFTVNHVAANLQSAINEKGTVKLEVPHYVETFKSTMNWVNAQDISLASLFSFQPAISDVGPTPENPTPGNSGNPQQPQIQPGQVAALPTLPKAVPDKEFKFGRSVVLPPLPPQQPAQPDQGAGAPAVQQVMAPQPVDKDWVTQLFHLNLGDIDAAFTAVNIPPPLKMTAFLQVELVREEQKNGKWDPTTDTVIRPIGVWRTQQAPPQFPAGGPRDAEAAYYQWATTNQPDILEPLFYAVQKGDQWTKPGAQLVAQQAVFDPKNFLVGPIPTWATPEQRKAINDARQADYKHKQEEKQKNRPAPKNPRPSGAGRPGGPTDMPEGLQVRDPQSGTGRYTPFAAAPPAPRRTFVPPPSDMPDAMDVGMPGAGGAAPNMPQNLPVPGTDYPNQEFDPSKWLVHTIEIWAHDDTVQAGKTYRYKIRYKMKNPIWGANNVAINPALADQFAIVSPDSDWGAPVTVPPLVNFFVATSKGPGSNMVRFEVFRFDNGQQHSEVFNVSQGDQIGGIGKNGIDYRTKITVVDFRDDPRTGETQIILVDENGNLTTRSYHADQQDPLYQQLKQAVAQAKAAETPGLAAGTPGAPIAR